MTHASAMPSHTGWRTVAPLVLPGAVTAPHAQTVLSTWNVSIGHGNGFILGASSG